MERNYDLAQAMIYCAWPLHQAIAVIEADAIQTKKLEQYLSQNSYKNLLIIENDCIGYFYGDGPRCNQFFKHVIDGSEKPFLFSKNLWCIRFEINNKNKLFQNICSALDNNKLVIRKHAITYPQIYKEINRVSAFIKQDCENIMLTNPIVADIWCQLLLNTNMLLQLLGEAKFLPRYCYYRAIPQLIKANLLKILSYDDNILNKLEKEISYRKLFIPKLLYVLNDIN